MYNKLNNNKNSEFDDSKKTGAQRFYFRMISSQFSHWFYSHREFINFFPFLSSFSFANRKKSSPFDLYFFFWLDTHFCWLVVIGLRICAFDSTIDFRVWLAIIFFFVVVWYFRLKSLEKTSNMYEYILLACPTANVVLFFWSI